MTLREELHEAARGPAGMTAVVDLLVQAIERLCERIDELENSVPPDPRFMKHDDPRLA